MVNSLTESVLGVADKVLGKFVADKDLRAKLEHELKTELHRANMAQLEVNKVEAAHKSMFVAGWRPFVGWTCGVALAWHFVLAPFIIFFSAYFGVELPELPTFDMESLMTVLLGMLGLGGLRSFEKYKKLTK